MSSTDYLTGATAGLSGLYFAWANEICSNDNEERALVVVPMKDFAYVVQAVAPNFVGKTVDYPMSTAGLSYSIALTFLIIPTTLAVRHLPHKDARVAKGRAVLAVKARVRKLGRMGRQRV